MELLQKHETKMCIFTNFKDGDKEYWSCIFKDVDHPVNKKEELFRLSGAEHD